jgi:hypothetical protein
VTDILDRVKLLVSQGEVEVSRHGLQELQADGILLEDVIAGIDAALAVESYPEFHKGPSVLVLQYDDAGRPVHVVWGTARNATTPAVLVTAYRPDPKRWSADFMRREQ